jgi:hypothetical protein
MASSRLVNWTEARVERRASLSSSLVFIIYNFEIKRRGLPYHSGVIPEIGSRAELIWQNQC